jgi:hypothetical protein
MRKIVAKMRCKSVLRSEGAEQVLLGVVTADTEENKTWSKYTPQGEVTMTITNQDALGAFTPGAEYLLTFEPAT